MLRRTDPATTLLASALLAASTTSAVQLVPISGPLDAQGHRVVIDDVGFNRADVLVLLDTAGNAYETQDTGRTWRSITVPQNKNIELFGPFLQTSDNSMLYRDGQWMPMESALDGVSCSDMWSSSRGLAGCVEAVTGDVVFERSADSLLTWRPWFRVPSSTLAQFDLEAIDAVGADAGERIWWQIKNTTTLRGTSDGKTWIDVPAPALRDLYPDYAVGDTLYVRGTNANGVRLGLVTTDRGQHWDSVPTTQAGGASLHRAAPGIWLSSSRDSITDTHHFYFGPTYRGPWERLTDSIESATVSTHGHILLATSSTLAWLVPGTSGISRPTFARHRTASLRATESGWSIVWSEGATEGAWRLVAADGRLMSSGNVARGQKELAVSPQPQVGWLLLPGQEAPLAVPGTTKR